MRDVRNRVPAWALPALAALALSFGAAACGSDDDGGDASAGQSDTTAETTAGGGGSAADRKEASAVMPAQRERYNAGDGKAFCANLSAAGKREMSEYAATIPALNTRDCTAFMTRYTARVVKQGGAQRPVRIRKVTIDGDTAKVTMQGGLAGIRSIATYRLVKEDGAWKLDNPTSGAETRRLPEKYTQQ